MRKANGVYRPTRDIFTHVKLLSLGPSFKENNLFFSLFSTPLMLSESGLFYPKYTF